MNKKNINALTITGVKFNYVKINLKKWKIETPFLLHQQMLFTHGNLITFLLLKGFNVKSPLTFQSLSQQRKHFIRPPLIEDLLGGCIIQRESAEGVVFIVTQTTHPRTRARTHNSIHIHTNSAYNEYFFYWADLLPIVY